ncbi:MAG: tetratricopeptide repeat protein [Candidatus Binatia bacterium]
MTTRGAGAPRRDERWTVLAVCLSLVVAVVGLYAQTAHFEFVSLDDYYLLVLRPEVRSGLSATNLRWALTAVEPSWQPFTWVTHQLDFSVFGADPGPPHLVNAAWHAANAVLFFLALRALTGELWPSALAAALFAVHPLRAESVAWLSERKDVTSGFFWMLGLLAYAGYVKRGSTSRYLLVAAALVLGLTAKTMVMSLPLVLLLLDVWPLGSRGQLSAPTRARLTEKLPLFAITIAAVAMTVFTQFTIGGLRSADEMSIGWRLVNAPISYVTYLAQTFWPTRLGATYSHPAFVAGSDFGTYVGLAVGSVVLLLAVTAFCVAFAHRAPYLLVGWLWYLVALVPVIGLLQAGRQGHADRFTYIPVLGIAIMVAWSLRDLVARWPRARAASVGAAMIALGLCGALASRQIATWHDTRTLFGHAIAISDDNYFAHQTLGAWLFSTGEVETARTHLEAALRISPDSAYAEEQLGLVLERQGDRAGAVAAYERAIALSPTSFFAQRNLPALRAKLAPPVPPANDLVQLLDAVSASPDDAALRVKIGIALLEKQRYEEARVHLQRAVELAPDSAQPADLLGIALIRLNRFAEAEPHFAHAAALNPENAPTQQRLDWVRQQLGK